MSTNYLEVAAQIKNGRLDECSTEELQGLAEAYLLLHDDAVVNALEAVENFTISTSFEKHRTSSGMCKDFLPIKRLARVALALVRQGKN